MIKKIIYLEGLTCEACDYKVKYVLEQITDVNKVSISEDRKTAIVEMQKPISFSVFLDAIAPHTKYKLAEQNTDIQSDTINKTSGNWFQTYRPIVLIFSYITIITVLLADDLMNGLRIFMAGFFLVFSFFKLLNLKGFAESYAMYDIVAKKFPSWGYIYAFLELILGIAFTINLEPLFFNWAALILMTVSIIGVLESVFNKKSIKCACLGDVFNLPMSTVTIIEDGLMIFMSITMLYLM